MSTTKDQRQKLAQAGFVRVDGLKMYRGDESWTISPRPGEAGSHGRNNGRIVIVTQEGEMWLAAAISPVRILSISVCLLEIMEIKVARGGAWVPCSNGEYMMTRDLLFRLANPDWIPD